MTECNLLLDIRDHGPELAGDLLETALELDKRISRKATSQSNDLRFCEAATDALSKAVDDARNCSRTSVMA